MDGIFRRKDRDGYFISWIDADGTRKKKKAKFRTLEGARQELAAKLRGVAQTEILGFRPPGEDTFEEIAKRFLAYQRARLAPRSYEREDWVVNHQLKPFFRRKVAAIRRTDVQRYVTERRPDVSAGTVSKELVVLKHLLRLAVEWEVMPFNPAQGVKGPKIPPGRVRYLQPTELRDLLDVCPEWLRPIAALAACTGMRRGEILGLRWLDVDMVNHRIMLPLTKNGEGRIVYLNQSALAALGSLPVDERTKMTDRLFAAVTPNQASVAFQRACQKLGIQDFRFHDLRHTAASWMRMAGADIHTVAQILGHKDLRMAIRYQHLSPAFLAEAVGRLDAVFGNLRPHSVPETNLLNEAEEVSLVI